jgi:hypothetical protein
MHSVLVCSNIIIIIVLVRLLLDLTFNGFIPICDLDLFHCIVMIQGHHKESIDRCRLVISKLVFLCEDDQAIYSMAVNEAADERQASLRTIHIVH